MATATAIAQNLNVAESAILRVEEWANVFFAVVKGLGARFVSKKATAMTEQIMTPQDLKAIKPLSGGWYEYKGKQIGYSEIAKQFAPWVEEQGGIHVTSYNYGATAIAVGKNPVVPANAAIHQTVVVRQSDVGFAHYLSSVILSVLDKDLAEYAGYGEDSNDDVKDNAMIWF